MFRTQATSVFFGSGTVPLGTHVKNIYIEQMLIGQPVRAKHAFLNRRKYKQFKPPPHRGRKGGVGGGEVCQ